MTQGIKQIFRKKKSGFQETSCKPESFPCSQDMDGHYLFRVVQEDSCNVISNKHGCPRNLPVRHLVETRKVRWISNKPTTYIHRLKIYEYWTAQQKPTDVNSHIWSLQ